MLIKQNRRSNPNQWYKSALIILQQIREFASRGRVWRVRGTAAECLFAYILRRRFANRGISQSVTNHSPLLSQYALDERVCL